MKTITTTTLTYTLPELKEHIGGFAYERALDTLRDGQTTCFEYETPFQWGDGNYQLRDRNIPIRITKLSIDSLSDNPIDCVIDWKRTQWQIEDDATDFLNDDTARKIKRIMKVIGCDLHEFIDIGRDYYSRHSNLQPHYRYQSNRTKRIDSVISEVVEVISSWTVEIEHFIAQDYSRTVEYTYSEENILEVAEINEYKFNESGDLL